MAESAISWRQAEGIGFRRSAAGRLLKARWLTGVSRPDDVLKPGHHFLDVPVAEDYTARNSVELGTSRDQEGSP